MTRRVMHLKMSLTDAGAGEDDLAATRKASRLSPKVVTVPGHGVAEEDNQASHRLVRLPDPTKGKAVQAVVAIVAVAVAETIATHVKIQTATKRQPFHAVRATLAETAIAVEAGMIVRNPVHVEVDPAEANLATTVLSEMNSPLNPSSKMTASEQVSTSMQLTILPGTQKTKALVASGDVEEDRGTKMTATTVVIVNSQTNVRSLRLRPAAGSEQVFSMTI